MGVPNVRYLNSVRRSKGMFTVQLWLPLTKRSSLTGAERLLNFLIAFCNWFNKSHTNHFTWECQHQILIFLSLHYYFTALIPLKLRYFGLISLNLIFILHGNSNVVQPVNKFMLPEWIDFKSKGVIVIPNFLIWQINSNFGIGWSSR